MSSLKNKANVQSNDSAATTEYVKTDYWVNIRSEVAPPLGINLTEGIREHAAWLELLSEVTVDELNAEFEELGEPIRVVKAGNATSAKVQSLADRIKAKRNQASS